MSSRKKGKLQLTTGPVSQHWYHCRGFKQHYFLFNKDSARSQFCVRKCYPKTCLAKPSESDPAGPRSASEMFRWAPQFLERLVSTYGKAIVEQKFAKWNMDVTTCFSGIGCAETVQNSVISYIVNCFNLNLTSASLSFHNTPMK